MRWLTQLRRRTEMLFRRNGATARLDDELRFHIDCKREDLIATGVPNPPASSRIEPPQLADPKECYSANARFQV